MAAARFAWPKHCEQLRLVPGQTAIARLPVLERALYDRKRGLHFRLFSEACPSSQELDRMAIGLFSIKRMVLFRQGVRGSVSTVRRKPN